jgi:hypothetical protein
MLKALPKKKQYWVTIQSPLNHFALAGASGFRLVTKQPPVAAMAGSQNP